MENKRRLVWIGAACLVAIIPVKLLRHFEGPTTEILIGVAPSVLGPAGLLFLLRSTADGIPRLSFSQTAMLVGFFAASLELLQLAPRPGLLSHMNYTFDLLDLVAGVLGTIVAYYAAERLA